MIPLPPTLLIPLAAYWLTPLSVTAAWAAWAIGVIGSVFLPAAQSALEETGRYILHKKEGEPPSPTEFRYYRPA